MIALLQVLQNISTKSFHVPTFFSNKSSTQTSVHRSVNSLLYGKNYPANAETSANLFCGCAITFLGPRIPFSSRRTTSRKCLSTLRESYKLPVFALEMICATDAAFRAEQIKVAILGWLC
jgi:hypothetical protein